MSEVQKKGKAAKDASYLISSKTTTEKNAALALIAEQLLMDKDEILSANQQDYDVGKENGLSIAVLDRILLTSERIQDMADAIHLLIDLSDPIGEVLEIIEKENGLRIEKKRVPMGVIGMIYEARPNVTVDAATLALKTGNSVVLRGSSSAKNSNKALVQSIHKALEKSYLPMNAIQLIEDTSRETAKELFKLHEYLDVLIPRGGKKLIDTVVREASVPVIETGAGNCHIFIDAEANLVMAGRIVINAKTQRPSVCNAVETIIIHEKWFANNGENFISLLRENKVALFGESKISNYEGVKSIEDMDWASEFLDLSLRLKVVATIDEAIDHIRQFGTKHSEAIITDNEQTASIFLNQVDAAVVYHNASTRFTDGFEFGYGAEIGISTQKSHARGPMGLHALTSSKFSIYGNGQIRV